MIVPKPVTSMDVARRAGVSRASVSRALNNEACVTEKTRKKIIRAADELGYQINLLGRSLNRQRTDLVGLVIRQVTDPFHARLLESLLDQFKENGLLPMVNEVGSDRDIPELMQKYVQFRVSGVVVTSGSPPAGIARECEKLGIPVVLINRQPLDDTLDTVCSDNDQGGELAATRLMAAGCRKLGFLGEMNPTFSTRAREAGFNRAMAPFIESGTLTLDRIPAPFSGYKGGFEAGKKTGKMSHCQGIFCATDRLAMGFMDGCKSVYGMTAGREYSIIGFDDIEEAGFSAYNLTTVHQDANAIASKVMERLTLKMTDSFAENSMDIVPVALVERGSVLPRI